MISVWHIVGDSWKPGSACTLVKYVREGGEELPDMALCQNQTCPSREHCFRFKVHEVYAQFQVPGKADRCGYYIPTKAEEK